MKLGCTALIYESFQTTSIYRAGGISPAAPVLAGSQGKSKLPVLQKASNIQSASTSVILGLIRLIILDRKAISRGERFSHIPFIVMLIRYSVVQKLTNKQNGG